MKKIKTFLVLLGIPFILGISIASAEGNIGKSSNTAEVEKFRILKDNTRIVESIKILKNNIHTLQSTISASFVVSYSFGRPAINGVWRNFGDSDICFKTSPIIYASGDDQKLKIKLEKEGWGWFNDNLGEHTVTADGNTNILRWNNSQGGRFRVVLTKKTKSSYWVKEDWAHFANCDRINEQ